MVKEKTKSIWINKYSIMFYVAMLLVALSWFIFPNWPKTIKIIAVILFLIADVLFNIKNKDAAPNLFLKLLNWMNFVLMTVFTIIYIALSVGEINIAIWLLLSSFVAILIASLVFNLIGIFNTENLGGIIVSYLIISFLIITLFGFGFTLIAANENNQLVWTESETKVDAAWDYVYFSSSLYYSNSFGDIQPLGYSRILMQFESVVSYIFHVIVLGFVVSNISKKKAKI